MIKAIIFLNYARIERVFDSAEAAHQYMFYLSSNSQPVVRYELYKIVKE